MIFTYCIQRVFLVFRSLLGLLGLGLFLALPALSSPIFVLNSLSASVSVIRPPSV